MKMDPQTLARVIMTGSTEDLPMGMRHYVFRRLRTICERGRRKGRVEGAYLGAIMMLMWFFVSHAVFVLIGAEYGVGAILGPGVAIIGLAMLNAFATGHHERELYGLEDEPCEVEASTANVEESE